MLSRKVLLIHYFINPVKKLRKVIKSFSKRLLIYNAELERMLPY